MKLLVFIFICLISLQIFAANINLRIIKDQAPVVVEPQENAQVMFYAPKGKVLTSDGIMRSGYYHLLSKSGKNYWIHQDHIENQQQNIADDLVSPHDNDRRGISDRNFPHFSYDLGASSGSYNDQSYMEVQFGLNTFFKDWMIWRNAAFLRQASGLENIYGLDTSLRGGVTVGGRSVGLHAFAGPGYRFVNKGDNVPFMEAGMIFRLLGLELGGGAKVLYYSFVKSGYANDTQFFIVLSGGGSF